MPRVSEEEIERIIHLYQVEKHSLAQTAELMYIDKGAVRKVLKQSGIEIRWNNRACKPIAMILHDWNSGKPTRTIMSTYGFETVNQFHTWLSNQRKQGYKFNRRYADRIATKVRV